MRKGLLKTNHFRTGMVLEERDLSKEAEFAIKILGKSNTNIFKHTYEYKRRQTTMLSY